MQLYKWCSHHQDASWRFEECPESCHLHLWEWTTNMMQYPKLKSVMLYSNWLPQLFHLLQSTWCQMMRIAVSVLGIRTYSKKIALTFNFQMWWRGSHCHGLPTQDTSFGNPSKTPTQTAQKLPCQVKFKTPPWRQGQAKSIQVTIHIFRYIAGHVVMTHIEATSGHDTRIITNTPEVASQHSCSTYRDYSHWSHHKTPHWSDCRSSTHMSSSAYHPRDQSRSHSHPSYKSSRRDLHRSHSHSSNSWGKPHHKKNPSENRRSPTWTITVLMTTPVTQERRQII